MNLWRWSKSWFQEDYLVQKGGHERQHCLQEQKGLLTRKYESEKDMLEKHHQQQLVEAKLRLKMEMRRLEEKCNHVEQEDDEREFEKDRVDFLPLTKKNWIHESDGLEWDPSDNLGSYGEDEINDSWDLQSNVSWRLLGLTREQFDDVESCDSAYSSSSAELAKVFLSQENTLVTGYERSEEEWKVEQLRLAIRREVVEECEEKFRQERNFLYSIIDELEENVSLLRKQKEDIVKIFEFDRKRQEKSKENCQNEEPKGQNYDET